MLIKYWDFSVQDAQLEAKEILENVDINNNGQIDFTEFVIANVSSKDIMTDDKLRSAFNMLDRDGNGRITKEDLAEVFKGSSEIGQEVLEEMMAEADDEGRGEITFA
mmetsp:Transcript_15499/g.11279  ORF Transcript_15499/g.11279 Transcript_15499/m.11279 type:complete len:107 (+) Transcript_15499:767-1087(+)